MNHKAPALVFLLGLIWLFACSSEGPESDEDALVEDAKGDVPISVPKAGTTLVSLTQPSLVAAIEQAGFGLGAHLSGSRFRTSNAELASRSSFYASLASDVESAMTGYVARDPKLRTEVSHGVTRIFDKGWLRSNYATLELAGIVFRPDREEGCGETRFLYRLAYERAGRKGEVSYSRIPLVLNVVYQNSEPCAAYAKAWQVPQGIQTAEAYVRYLTETVFPLSRLSLKQVELNTQALRVPSEAKTDLGGVADYLFAVYRSVAGKAERAPLENTPDVPRLLANEPLRRELATFLLRHVADIDTGTIRIPEKFLAKEAHAFSTFGSARIANKPFSRLYFDGATGRAPFLESADLAATSYVKSARALLARLDDLSCMGCHQGGRSIAGFHFLGEDSLSRSHPLNVARVGVSPHFLSEQARRVELAKRLSAGQLERGVRPTSFASEAGKPLPRGAPCAITDGLPQSGTCAAGLTCQAVARNSKIPFELGQCLPALDAKGPLSTYRQEFAGLPCMQADITDNPDDPRRDQAKLAQFACRSESTREGGSYTCRPPAIGVPGGLCARTCKAGNVPYDKEHELCAYAGGKEFDECANRNDFSRCLSGAIQAGLREACDEDEPCREDYVCQKFIKARRSPPEEPADGRGYCVPTYFLFQVRTDGHPNPTPIR